MVVYKTYYVNLEKIPVDHVGQMHMSSARPDVGIEERLTQHMKVHFTFKDEAMVFTKTILEPERWRIDLESVSGKINSIAADKISNLVRVYVF